MKDSHLGRSSVDAAESCPIVCDESGTDHVRTAVDLGRCLCASVRLLLGFMVVSLSESVQPRPPRSPSRHFGRSENNIRTLQPAKRVNLEKTRHYVESLLDFN